MELNIVTIAVMGATGSGKTTLVNKVSGSNLTVGYGLESCTTEVQVTQPFEYRGKKVILVDTPGFDDTEKSDTEILRVIASFLCQMYKRGMKLSGIIYLHRITDTKFGGNSTRNFRMFRRMCGDEALKNVALVTTRWDDISLKEGETRESELQTNPRFFKPALDKGATLIRHRNADQSARNILDYLLNKEPVVLAIQHELVDLGKNIEQTEAGGEIDRLLYQLREQHTMEIEKARKEMERAARQKAEQERTKAAEERRRLNEEVAREQARAEEHRAHLREIEDAKERKRNEIGLVAGKIAAFALVALI